VNRNAGFRTVIVYCLGPPSGPSCHHSGHLKLAELPDWDWRDISAHLKCTARIANMSPAIAHPSFVISLTDFAIAATALSKERHVRLITCHSGRRGRGLGFTDRFVGCLDIPVSSGNPSGTGNARQSRFPANRKMPDR
jgi:hypothetical protein